MRQFERHGEHLDARRGRRLCLQRHAWTAIWALTKSGSGTQTLSGANTYTGNTIISAGTLALGSGGSLASASSVSIGGRSDL